MQSIRDGDRDDKARNHAHDQVDAQPLAPDVATAGIKPRTIPFRKGFQEEAGKDLSRWRRDRDDLVNAQPISFCQLDRVVERGALVGDAIDEFDVGFR